MDDRRIGRFRILSEHGRGAMGMILRGQDDTLGRTSAIKLLPPERVRDEEARARFQREAAAVARLKHDHIATLYEFSDDPDQPYLAMEWVEGISLEEKLKKGPLSVDLAVSLLGQILSALDYAHTQGVVHRDIKPANLMLSADQKVTLVDFGLAFLLAEPYLTTTGPLFGTPLYMPPEMASGEEVDGRADLYSAALVFFEMLTGKRAFGPGTVVQIVSQQVHAARPVLSEHAVGLPIALDAVLQKAMARQPAQRYPTGKAFQEAVLLASDAGPPPTSTGRLRAAGVFTSLALLMLAVGIGRTRTSLPPGATPTATASRTPPVGLVYTPTPVWTPVDVDAAHSYGLSEVPGQPGAVWQRPIADVQAIVQAQGRLLVSGKNFVQSLDAATGQPGWRAAVGGVPTLSPRSEPPETLLLQQSNGWQCLQLTDGKPKWGTSFKEPVIGGVLSDNDVLYTTTGSTLIALDPSDGTILWRAPTGATLMPVAPVVDNSLVYLVTQGPRVLAFDLKSKKQAWKKTPPGRPTCLTLSPSGELLVGCQDGQVASYSVRDGQESWEDLDTLSSPVAGIASVTDLTVVTCRDGVLAAYDTEGTSPWQTPPGESPAGPAQTDGDSILVATRSGQLICLDANHDPRKAQEKWRIPTPRPCTAAPLCVDNWVFLALSDGVAAMKAPLPAPLATP